MLQTTSEQGPTGTETVLRVIALSKSGDDPLIASLMGHEDRIIRQQFIADGSRVVTLSDDNTARIWNARSDGSETVIADDLPLADGSGSRLRVREDSVLYLNNRSELVEASLSEPFGKQVICSFGANRGRVSGEEVLTGGGRNALAVLAEDSRRAASVERAENGRSHKIRIIDVAGRREIAALDHDDPQAETLELGFSPESGILLAVGRPPPLTIPNAPLATSVRLWNATAGRPMPKLEGELRGTVTTSFSPNGQTVAIALQNKTVGIWETATGRRVATLQGHKGQVEKMVYSPDGKYLLTLGGWVNNTEVDWRRIVNENTVRLWRTEDGSLVFDTGKANGAITRFGFSHSAKFCFATDQSRVRVWQVEAGMLFSEKPLDDLRGRVSIRAGLATNEPGFVSTGRLAVYFLDSGEFEVIGEMGKSFAEVSSATLVDSIMPFETSPDGKRVLLSYPSNLSILFDVVSGLRTLQRYAEGGFGTTPNAS